MSPSFYTLPAQIYSRALSLSNKYEILSPLNGYAAVFHFKHLKLDGNRSSEIVLLMLRDTHLSNDQKLWQLGCFFFSLTRLSRQNSQITNLISIQIREKCMRATMYHVVCSCNHLCKLCKIARRHPRPLSTDIFQKVIFRTL